MLKLFQKHFTTHGSRIDHELPSIPFQEGHFCVLDSNFEAVYNGSTMTRYVAIVSVRSHFYIGRSA